MTCEILLILRSYNRQHETEAHVLRLHDQLLRFRSNLWGGWLGVSGCEVGFPGDGMDNESIISHVASVGEDGQWSELNEAEAAVVSRAGRTLERREARLRLEAFDEVLARSCVVRLVHDLQRHCTCTHTQLPASLI